jgi:hypothetical protein
MPLIVAHSRETARVFFHEAEPHAATNPIQFELNSIQAQGKGKGKGNAERSGEGPKDSVVSKNVMKNEQKFKVLNSAIQSAPAFAFSRAMAWSLMISPRTVSVISL